MDIYNNNLLVETTVVDPRYKVAVFPDSMSMKERVKKLVLLELGKHVKTRGDL